MIDLIIPLTPPLEKGDICSGVGLLNAVLAAVGEDIVFYILLCLINSEVAFAEDICIEVE